jgi:hypothetical protein
MVTLERRLGGLIRYRKVFFATREAAVEIVRSLGPNEVVRLFAVTTELGDLPHLVEQRETFTTCVDLSLEPEQILGAMKRKSCRYEIRRAEKMLSTISIERNSERALHDFLPLYNSFAKGKGPVPTLSTRQFHQVIGQGDAFVLYHHHQPICCHLFLRDAQARIVRLLHSGSRRFESGELAAHCGSLNRFLHWHAMQQYRAEGILTYDLGGIRNLTHPTARFKLSFGGAVVTEYYYLFGGATWLARLGGTLYGKFSKSAAPSLSTQPQGWSGL